VVLPYLIARLFFKTYGQIHVFLVTTLGIATTIATALVVLSFTPLYAGGRLQILKANPIPTGTLLAIGLVIAVIGLTSDLLGKSKKSKGFCIAAILLCFYGLFLSGVRGPLISAIVGLAFYFLILLVRRPRVPAVVGAVAVLLFITFNIWYPYIVRTVPNIGGYSLQAITQGLSTQYRLERYRTAATLFAQNPLLGVGTDGFAQLTGLGYPHNICLEIASENGLIGLLVFVCFLGSITWYGLRWIAMHPTIIDPQARAIGLTVLVVALTLLVEKQFSYGLTMHKDLFAFLGLVVNLPLIARLSSRPNSEDRGT
jgi:O-antigen ligase